jgi:hypothetical protein
MQPFWRVSLNSGGYYLFAAAKAGSVQAQKFWLSRRAGWRERGEPDGPMPGIEAGSNSHVVLHLSDNGRDPELTEVLAQSAGKILY